MGQQPVVWIVTDVISLFGRFAPVNLAYLAIALLCLLRYRLHPLRCCGRRLVIP